MANYQNILSPQGAWSNTTQYRVAYIPGSAQIGLGYVSCPSVTYNSVTYVALGPSQPTLGTAPDTDSAWTIIATTETGASVLATPLTGFTATSGTPTATSTVLQAFQNLSYQTYAYLAGINGAVTAGAITLTGSTNALSSNITVGATSISVPLSKIFKVEAILNVTTAATSGATFTVTATNATVLGAQAISIGASVTGGNLIVTGLVQSTATLAPTISITASAVTGTVTLNNTSVIQVFAN